MRSSYGFAEGMMIGAAKSRMAQAAGVKEKVFDWDKAAKIIKELQPKKASAGLAEDWDCTSMDIFVDGKVVKDEYDGGKGE